MSTDTPEREPVNKPTPENVAESLTAYDNDYDEGNFWWPSLTADGGVVHIKITPHDEDGEHCTPVHFRAVVVEGDQTPIVLERPAELGLPSDDGGDLLALTESGIRLYPPDAAWLDLDPAEAREWAAQLAAMADALDAANGGGSK